MKKLYSRIFTTIVFIVFSSAAFSQDDPPVANCQNITIQLDASGNASITANDIDNGSTDDIGIASLTASVTSFTCADYGTNNITLTVTDTIGQTDTCNAVVTVQIPTATISSSPVSPLCQGEPVTFTSIGINLGTNPQYEWFVSSISVGNNSATYTTTGINNGDDVYVEITSGACNTVTTSNTIIVATVIQTATVDAGLDASMCSNETLPLFGVFGGSATSGSWTSASGGFTNGNTYHPSISGGYVTLYYVTNNPPGPCGPAIDSMEVLVRPFRAAIASNLTTISDCTDTTIQLSGNRTGVWSADSAPSGSPYSFSNVNDPNATFIGESGVNYDISWTVDNLAPCFDRATFNVAFPACTDINFDGVDDYINFENNNSLSGTFSIETWIKPTIINSNNRSILSKRDASDPTTGYDLRLANNTVSFHANGFNISANGITTTRWYHVAVTYDGTDYTIYVDGILRNSSAGPSPIANTDNMLVGAISRPNNSPTSFYRGWIDELRFWNIALSTEQIREMMNQEIEDNTVVRGSVLGLDVAGLNWSNLDAYYQMNQGTDIASGLLVGNIGVSGRLNNIITLQEESAPLPYISANDGNWDAANTWLNSSVQMRPNTNNVNWNIVRTSHNVSSGNRPTNLLGLIIDSNAYSITNNQSLQVSHYLKIDGTLDLVGESQLLQDSGSSVDYTGTGKLERDQQGTTNLYNYNFWSSPVGTNNSTYALDNVLYDGTNTINPLLATWTSSPNSIGSTIPVTLSSRWLYLYENFPEDTYADWNAILESTPISVGLGFTMKGSGNIGLLQNYTFTGQPNNGTITSPITAGYQALIGNPYPSAIDAHTFITDNSSALLDGTLYFWEHASSNASHTLTDYEGGYSYLNITGGTAAVSPPAINGVGDATKIPERYVPVGQGFFVTGNATGGTIQFNNDQRAFVKESSGSSIFMRNANSNEEAENNNKYVRIDFVSPENATRHLLLGFIDDNLATNGVDYGYDALNNDTFPNDMSFEIEGDKYIIQGVGDFVENQYFPLVIDLTTSGTIEIQLADIENFEEDINVFIYDAFEGTFTKFNDLNFQITLEAGNYINRFFLVFQEDPTLSTIEDELEDIMVNYLQTNNEIYINAPKSIQVKHVYLVNITGQTVASWDATKLPLSDEIRIPVKSISEGNYILKVETNYTTYNKKIIIKY